MNKKEVLEIRKQFSPKNCAITKICGCYVDYEKNPLLTSMAAEGMRIYFVSLFFSGINMVSATYLSASDQPVPGFIISILRGLVLILPIAFLLAALFGMTGIWLCLPVTEAIVCVVTFFFLRKF